MDRINLYRPRHIESLIVPSTGAILMKYLPHPPRPSVVRQLADEGGNNVCLPAQEGRSENTESRIENTKVLGRIFLNEVSSKEDSEVRIQNTEKIASTKQTLKTKSTIHHSQFNIQKSLRPLASALLVVSLGGITGPIIPEIRLEAKYLFDTMKTNVIQKTNPIPPLPPSVPTVFDPLIKPDGEKIIPINTDFSIIIPKVGINAAVVSKVDPKSEASYLPALSKGVAHASTSFLPDQDGTMYLFSHSTNYDWFVKDLNAVFYHLKSLDAGDLIVVVYKNTRYTYKLREKKVVAPSEISYLIPQRGTKTLILQTCWPPGSTAERLLIFADLIDSTLLTE